MLLDILIRIYCATNQCLPLPGFTNCPR